MSETAALSQSHIVKCLEKKETFFILISQKFIWNLFDNREKVWRARSYFIVPPAYLFLFATRVAFSFLFFGEIKRQATKSRACRGFFVALLNWHSVSSDPFPDCAQKGICIFVKLHFCIHFRPPAEWFRTFFLELNYKFE